MIKSDIKNVATAIVDSLPEYVGDVAYNVPVLMGENLHCQAIYEDTEGGLAIAPLNRVNLFKKGFPAYNIMFEARSLEHPQPWSKEDLKAMEGQVEQDKIKLLCNGLFGKAINSEVKLVRHGSPFHKKVMLFDDYLDGPDREISHETNGVVTVVERKFNDEIPSDIYLKLLEVLYPLKGDRQAIIDWQSLLVFRDRRGKATPLLHLFGPPGTGKSAVIALNKALVGESSSRAINMQEGSSRFLMPDAALNYIDEMPEMSSVSLKYMFALFKKLTKATEALEFDVKGKTAVSMRVPGYTMVCSNDPIAMCSDSDRIDNFVGLYMGKELVPDDFIVDGVDLLNEVKRAVGIPLNYIRDVLWPNYCKMNESKSRFGMKIYQSPDYHGARKSEGSYVRDMLFECIMDYLRLYKKAEELNAEGKKAVITLETLGKIFGTYIFDHSRYPTPLLNTPGRCFLPSELVHDKKNFPSPARVLTLLTDRGISGAQVTIIGGVEGVIIPTGSVTEGISPERYLEIAGRGIEDLKADRFIRL